MRVLITGGTGNLAEYLIKELEKDHELVLFDRLKPGEGRAQTITEHSYVSGDLTNGEDCARAVAGCDAIVHLGAIPYATDALGVEERLKAQGRPILPYNETMRVNTMGTYEIMRGRPGRREGRGDGDEQLCARPRRAHERDGVPNPVPADR